MAQHSKAIRLGRWSSRPRREDHTSATRAWTLVSYLSCVRSSSRAVAAVASAAATTRSDHACAFAAPVQPRAHTLLHPAPALLHKGRRRRHCRIMDRYHSISLDSGRWALGTCQDGFYAEYVLFSIPGQRMCRAWSLALWWRIAALPEARRLRWRTRNSWGLYATIHPKIQELEYGAARLKISSDVMLIEYVYSAPA